MYYGNMNVGGSTLQWDWSQGSGGIPDTFQVEVGTTPGGTEIGTTAVIYPATSITLSTLLTTPGRYYVRVFARNTGEDSADTNEIDFQAVKPPIFAALSP